MPPLNQNLSDASGIGVFRDISDSFAASRQSQRLILSLCLSTHWLLWGSYPLTAKLRHWKIIGGICSLVRLSRKQVVPLLGRRVGFSTRIIRSAKVVMVAVVPEHFFNSSGVTSISRNSVDVVPTCERSNPLCANH